MKHIKTFNEHYWDEIPLVGTTYRVAMPETRHKEVKEEEEEENENSLKHIAVMKNIGQIMQKQDQKQIRKHMFD
jgi:hypothetical protein